MSRTRLRPFAIAAVIAVGLIAVVVGSPAFVLVIGAAVALLALPGTLRRDLPSSPTPTTRPTGSAGSSPAGPRSRSGS